MKCNICEREVEESRQYCSIHAKAFRNLRESYEIWRLAFGDLPPKDFLERIVKRSETGDRAKELAVFLTEHQEKWDKSEL